MAYCKIHIPQECKCGRYGFKEQLFINERILGDSQKR